jgi:Putative MetA-pathway of phenol degradation
MAFLSRAIAISFAASLAFLAAAQTARDALDNPVLTRADEEDVVPYIESYVAFRYRHDSFDEGLGGDELRIHWLQSFGPSSRFAAGIELPFISVRGGKGDPDETGLGDIKLDFRGMVSKGEKFEHAFGIDVTLPSSTHLLLDDGQTELKPVWGFSAQVTGSTLLSGDLGYNKAVQTRREEPKFNNLESTIVLSQAFVKRFAVFVESDSYYEFSYKGYAQTLKPGAELLVDRREKWSLSPYVLVSLTHLARLLETKVAVGMDLSYKF